MAKKVFVVYCSPAGATRIVARQIEQSLSERALEINVLDLEIPGGRDAFFDMIRSSTEGDCLFVGSPVYRDVAVPPVMAFLDALPKVHGTAAVPFVTWGAVTSGIALWQMGRSLAEKGFVLVGAAAVVAEHCMMWRSETASGAGRPDSEDLQKVDDFARDVFERLRSPAPRSIALADLDYQKTHHAAEMKRKIDQPWMIVPKTVEEEKCTECGICAEQCPVGAVTLSPFPIFAGTCFDCFNCVRLCPEEAIDTPLSAEDIEEHIAQLKEKYGEVPETRVFLASQK